MLNNGQPYDVAVLGAGIAGSAAAIALKRAGVARVLLIGSGNPKQMPVGECLPPDVRRPLARLGLWESFLGQGHEACPGSRSVWGGDSPGFNDFLFNPHGSGWHVDRRRFEAWLLERATAVGADLRSDLRFRAATRRSEGGFRLQLIRPVKRCIACAARVVIDATGNRAAFAQSQGATREVFDRLINISVMFERVDPGRFDPLTRLEAVEHGWWYGARLPGGRAVLSVSADPDEVRRLRLATFRGWARALTRTRLVAEGLEGAVCRADSLTAVPAFSSRLDLTAGGNWAALGDAAACFDPISAQGMMKALTGALSAAPEVVRRLGGDTTALASMQGAHEEDFAVYARNRAYFYDQERRWPEAPFWRRRRAASKRHEISRLR